MFGPSCPVYDLAMSRPWPPGAELERRGARMSLLSPTIGVLVGDVVILSLLISGRLGHYIWFGPVLAGMTVFALGSFWLTYHLRKLGAIKKAAAREN